MSSNKFILENFIIMGKIIDYFLFKRNTCDEHEKNASTSIKP